jgi:hypothetical protein
VKTQVFLYGGPFGTSVAILGFEYFNDPSYILNGRFNSSQPIYL